MKRIFSSYFILFVILILQVIVCTQLLLKDPAVWPDEPFFIATAESILQNGHMAMPLYGTSGIGHPEIRMYSYPPLYFYLLSGWIRVFGTSIQSLRILSVLTSLAVLTTMYLLVKKITHHSSIAGIAAISLLLFAPFGMASRIARMDIFVLLGIVVTMLFITSVPKKNYAVYAGLASGCSLLFHPVGILASVFGILYILLFVRNEMRFRIIRSYILPIVCSVCIWGIVVLDRSDLFITQMQLQFFYKEARTALLSILFERDMYWRLILMLYMFIGSTGIISGIISQKKWFIFSGIATYICLIFLLIAVDQWYFIFLPLFPVLLVSTMVHSSLSSNKTYIRISVIVLLLSVVVIHGAGSITGVISHIKRNEQYEKFSKGISDQIPEGKTVVVSAIPDPYFELVKRNSLKIYQVPHVSEKESLGKLLQSADILIYNYVTNTYLPDYIQSHTLKKVTVVQEEGYQTDVIFLKK